MRQTEMTPGDAAFLAYMDRTKRRYGLTVMTLADSWGIAHGTVDNWRADPGRIKLRDLRRLVRDHGMTAEDVLRILEVEE